MSDAYLYLYGTAICVKHDDGTITVQHADRVIGVTRDLWNQMTPPHKQDGGRLQLDTAGEYVYRFERDAPHPQNPDFDVLIFRRLEETP